MREGVVGGPNSQSQGDRRKSNINKKLGAGDKCASDKGFIRQEKAKT